MSYKRIEMNNIIGNYVVNQSVTPKGSRVQIKNEKSTLQP